MIDDYLRRALLATVYDVARESPLERAPVLSARLGRDVWIKREDLQPIFSFKLRGAYNKMVRLGAEGRARGVVAASAGNHAQGVALAAKRLGARAVIVMPRTTPAIKVDAVRALGGEVVLFGDAYDEAAGRARAIEREEGLAFVHPYDDPDVIAGQATIGIEILRQAPAVPAAIFVPVGGGGLIAGVGAAVKALRPEVRVVCVEPEDAAGMTRSLAAGRRVTLDRVGRFAEGVAVAAPGEETFRVAREVVDECITVSTDEMCAAIKDLFEDRRAVLEPSGALAYAGLKKWSESRAEPGGMLVAIASGANMNFDRLRQVSERAEVGERREAVLAVTIPERPGSFRELCAAIGARAVTELNYRYAGPDAAHVLAGVKVESRAEREVLIRNLEVAGYRVVDLTDDEVAKLHVRHMVGGRARDAAHERLFSFVFPERVGALSDFLRAMRQPWNVSLFHYRNQGLEFGTVLVGLQVPPSDEGELDAFLSRLGFEWARVDDNAACRLFLA